MIGRSKKHNLRSSREFLEHRDEYRNDIKKLKNINVGYLAEHTHGLLYLCLSDKKDLQSYNHDAVSYDFQPKYKFSNGEIRIPITYQSDNINSVTCVMADISNKNNWRCVVRYGVPSGNKYIDVYECEQVPTNLHGVKFNVDFLLCALSSDSTNGSLTLVIIPPDESYDSDTQNTIQCEQRQDQTGQRYTKSSFSITQNNSYYGINVRRELQNEYSAYINPL